MLIIILMRKEYTLIIVDDEWAIRSNLSDLFPWSELGFSVKGVFENGLKALSYASSEKVDVILTDIRMPIMDGLELTRRIKEINKDISIILLSAYDDFEYAQKGIEYGAYDYLVKPVSYNEIIECFKSLHQKLEEIEDADSENLTRKAFDDYIRKNIISFSIKEASGHFQVSEKALKEWVNAEFNHSIQHIVNEIKMNKAKEMLDITGIKIFEIAQALGYTNSNNFTRAFLSYFKQSPTDYRKHI
mgnify:CR=1 FL=1